MLSVTTLHDFTQSHAQCLVGIGPLHLHSLCHDNCQLSNRLQPEPLFAKRILNFQFSWFAVQRSSASNHGNEQHNSNTSRTGSCGKLSSRKMLHLKIPIQRIMRHVYRLHFVDHCDSPLRFLRYSMPHSSLFHSVVSETFLLTPSNCHRLYLFVCCFVSAELEYWKDAQFKEDCYVRAQPSDCVTESCTADTCSINTYFVSISGDKTNTCADGECPEWDNGCVAFTYTTECTEQQEFETGDLVACYSYSEADNCANAGRLDADDEWSYALYIESRDSKPICIQCPRKLPFYFSVIYTVGNYTSYMVLMVMSIIFLVISVILFVVGIARCICKGMEDDILGEVKGTGCYFCCDYERMCYGEGTGHATIHNPQGKNLPGQGTRGGTAKAASGSIDSLNEEEQHALR